MLLEELRGAAGSLRSHAFRSGLTVLGITVGAFAIVLMTSLAHSGLTTLAAAFEELGGARLLLIAPRRLEGKDALRRDVSDGFTIEERRALKAALPHVQAITLYAVQGSRDVANLRGRTRRVDLVAGDAHTLTAFSLPVARGRGLSGEDEAGRARVCVVADDVATSLFAGAAVGQWLDVGRMRCRIVGQLARKEHWGMGFGFEWTNFVLVPLKTWSDHEANVTENALYLLQTEDSAHNDLVKRISNVLLLDRHNGLADFELWDFKKVMVQFQSIFTVMKVIVGLLAGIALLVGGIGVMNMMLASVSERVKEIGLRKALGAAPRDIQRQFLLEAGLLSGGGGLLGAGLGAGLSLLSGALIRHLKPDWVNALSWPAVGVAFAVSVGLGVSFGLFPALRAARLDPVEALRG